MKLSSINQLGFIEFVALFEPDLTQQQKDIIDLISKKDFKSEINYESDFEVKLIALLAIWNLCSEKETVTEILLPSNFQKYIEVFTQCNEYISEIELEEFQEFQIMQDRILFGRSIILFLNDSLFVNSLATKMAGIICDHFIMLAVDADNLSKEHLDVACASVTQKASQTIIAKKTN